MKKNSENLAHINLCENTIDELALVESVVGTAQQICLNLELNSQYYHGENFVLKLSEERNRYINLLTIALERIKNVQSLNIELEDNLT